jgi:hypothetical protein
MKNSHGIFVDWRYHMGLHPEELEARQLAADMVSDFILTDVNPTSSTYGQSVSPRDYQGQVSAWYFGHAT